MPRELSLALRARLTWLVTAASALLVGHGFVLAVDIFSASSRSAGVSAFQAREMDPLAGIVRPTLGGVDLAVSLLGPLVAARVLSIEKERRTFVQLALLEGSTTTLVVKKLAAAIAAAAMLLVAPALVIAGYAASGAHLDWIETAVALGGEALHVVLVSAVAIAAAAWTASLAQAATLGILVSLTSWGIDAADGFAALAWLGGASAWSIERRLAPFQKGIVSVGSLVWLGLACATAAVLAFLGASFDGSKARRAAAAAVVVALGAVGLAGAAQLRRGYDWSEQRRASLPADVVRALRGLSQSIEVDVFLDRDDSRRRELEADVLAKLSLARPDLVVRTPLDLDTAAREAARDDDYGRIVIRVGHVERVTRSTSRRELVTLVFEAAGASMPAWTPPPYPGFPHVVDHGRRTALVLEAYVVVPLAFVAAGYLLTRRRIVR